MQSQELINRYVYAVGEQLPKTSRADIEAELKSLLTETLDARAATEGRSADEEMTVQALREFGEPSSVARRYAPGAQALIGGAYYPLFVQIEKIVLAVLTVVFVVLTMIALLQAQQIPEVWGAIILESLSNYVSAAFVNFGIVVFIFAAIERLQATPPDLDEKWDPRKLPAVDNSNRVDRADAIATIVVDAILLALLNLAPHWLSLFFITDGAWNQLAIFGEGFKQYLPWISIALGMDILLQIFVLLRGRWTHLTRLAEIGTGLFSAVVLWMMISGGQIAATPALDPWVKFSVSIILIIVLIDAGINTYRLVTRRWNDAGNSLEIQFMPNEKS